MGVPAGWSGSRGRSGGAVVGLGARSCGDREGWGKKGGTYKTSH